MATSRRQKKVYKAQKDDKARNYQKVIQDIGKIFVSTIYKAVWNKTENAMFVNEVKSTYNEIMGQLLQMYTYLECIEKGENAITPDMQKMNDAIKDHHMLVLILP